MMLEELSNVYVNSQIDFICAETRTLMAKQKAKESLGKERADKIFNSLLYQILIEKELNVTEWRQIWEE